MSAIAEQLSLSLPASRAVPRSIAQGRAEGLAEGLGPPRIGAGQLRTFGASAPAQLGLQLPLRPGESVARHFYFCCDRCGWRTDRWVQSCPDCGHRGCGRVPCAGLENGRATP